MTPHMTSAGYRNIQGQVQGKIADLLLQWTSSYTAIWTTSTMNCRTTQSTIQRDNIDPVATISVLQLAIIGQLKNLDPNVTTQNNDNVLDDSSVIVWTATMPPTIFIKEDQLHSMTDRVLILKL